MCDDFMLCFVIKLRVEVEIAPFLAVQLLECVRRWTVKSRLKFIVVSQLSYMAENIGCVPDDEISARRLWKGISIFRFQTFM